MKAAAKDESSGTPWRRISTILLFAGVLMAALAFANSGRAAVETPPPPSVWSDKADYAPGEQVTLSGANWAPGESVHIRVNDDAGETWRRDVDVTAAGDGAISDEFNLPDWFVAVYTVTATGASSGAVTWTFTDAVNTTTGVASSLNPSTSGGGVTFTSTTTCSSACTFPAGSSVRFVENANNGCNGGTLLGTATTLTGSGNSRQAAFTTSTLSAGAHSIRACFDSTSTSGSNAQSSVSAPMTQTVNSDTTPPDTSITAQPSNPSNSSSASFSFTGTDNLTSASSLTFECNLDAGAFTSCTSPKSYSGLADGSHTFQVRATDAAGNTDATLASFTWFVDTTAPSTSIDSNPSDPTNSSAASFTFSGSDNHSAAGALSFECQLDSGGWASCTSPETVSVAQGSHTFEVRASDEAGNMDATPASYTWFVDTTAPSTSIDSNPSDPTNSTSASFTFSGTDNHSTAGDLTFECELDGAGFGSCSSPESYSALAEGSHTFKVRATDEAGNNDDTPSSFTWFVDTTPPDVSIDSTPSNPTNSTAAAFTFSATDNHSASGDIDFACQIDGGGFASCTSPKTYSGLVEGSHTFDVKATDEAGNDDTASYTWFVDTTSPETSIDMSPSDPTNSSAASFTFSGTDNHSAADDLTFECELDGTGFGSCSSPESYTSLAEGSHTFKVRATDEAGNTDVTPASLTWFVDLTPPETSTDSNPSDPTNSTSASFAFSGTDNHSAADDLTFECELDEAGFGSCSSPESYSALAEGSHTFKVRATDEAGNTDATPASFTWFVDTTAPDASIDSNPSDPSNDTSPSFTFSGSDNHSAAGALTFECRLDSGGWASCASPETVSVAQGSHTFEVRATDEAGNTDATPASFNWFVDTTAPDTTIISHPSDPTNSSAASFTFSGTDNHSAAGDLTFECELDGAGFGSCSSPKSYSGLGDGSHTFNVKATDEAGNTDATPDSFTWTVDTTGPSITLTTPPNGATYTQGQVVNASYSCSDSSGVATCIGTVANLAQINTATIGSKSFTVNATDALGNASSLTHNYSVVYNFSGFFSPVDNPPICNVVKAGQAVPIKFSLHGNQGMNIFAAGSPSSQPGTCSGLASDPLEETATAGQSTLNYDAQADQYVYVWKTEKSWSGTARLLTVTLADGTKHLARFTFTK